MGRKFARSGGGINRKYLSRVMESCGKDLTTAEEIVDDLESRHAIPKRLSRNAILVIVRKILNVRNNNGKRVKEEEDDEEVARRKKQRRIDESEENLRKRKKQRRSVSSEEDSGDGSSTSEDAIYSEKMSQRFDSINDSLRDNYAKINNSSSTKKQIVVSSSSTPAPPAEKIVEVETVSNKSRKMATMGSKRSPSVSGTTTAGNGDLVVKGVKTPLFTDFGGIKNVLDELNKTILFPIHNPRLCKIVEVKPPSGILLHGPPGCGKTMLAHAIANEANVPFYPISSTDVVSGVSGGSEENIRELFSKAYRTAPSIVFIDEIDAIGSKRDGLQREMEKRIVTQLLTCMDGPRDDDHGFVLVIGATNRPDALDPALRRSGRFDREIALSVPDEDARAEILSARVRKRGLRIDGCFDEKRIARLTAGFVGSDLEGLVNKAGGIALNRVIDARKSALSAMGEEDDRAWLWKSPFTEEEEEKLLYVKMSDFEEAVSVCQGSLTREGFGKVPDVKWDDVGGLEPVREKLNRYIIRPIQMPDIYKAFGADLETGFLLYGPPGCGKTLIAKAVANEAGANFICIKASELVSKYVGESERNVREMFHRAQRCSPCIIYFDEVDAITRSRGGEDGTFAAAGVLNQLLSELDGGGRRNVFVIGSTNRPDVVDPALLRPGRFGYLAYIPLPNAAQRVLILKAIARKKTIDPSVHLDRIANMCQDFTGADLANLVNSALHIAVDEIIKPTDEFSKEDGTKMMIKMAHFEQALYLVSPSVTKQQIEDYEELSNKLQR